MPNDALVDRLLSLPEAVTPSERLLLKLTAALVKQLDENYQFEQDNDARIRLSMEEFSQLPDRFELWNGLPRPKHWASPEREAAVERELLAVEALARELNIPEHQAWTEYIRRLSPSPGN